MFKVKTKFRLLSSLHMLIPVMIVVFFTRNTPFFFDTAFQIALTICLGLILFNTMFSPFLFGLQWLFFKQIQQIVSLCTDIQHGRYRYFIIPNEPVEPGDENELISLMRSMNWMVHQIERREELLERQVAERTRELENINAELTVARDAAKASSNAKGQFLATMSHEIRTPMNAITGMSELMLKAGLSPQMNEYATIINTSSKDLLKIINDILDFSKIDAGKLDIEVVPVNLRDLLEEVADVFKHSLAQKSVELITDIHETVPRQIKTDPLRLKQVMINLVSNAVKFTHEGEVLIRVTARNQENGTGFYLDVSIHDTGIGMDQQTLDHLFHAFTQADGSTSRKFGGTGLGLAISKNLVALMGGQISVSSTKGKGSCFSFTIHVQRAEENDFIPVGRRAELKGKSVLLSVKNATTGRVLERFLSLFGFKVTERFGVLKKKEEVAAICHDPVKFDLMVLDLELFGHTGLPPEFRQISSDAFPPVIAIGSIGTGTALNRLPAIRAFLSKPVKQSALFDAIMELFCEDQTLFEDSPVLLGGQYALHGACVLLVEDNRTNQTLAVEILRGQGIDTVVAATGAQALERLKNRTFDAVLMDVGLPDMDGYEATRLIRKLGKAANIPVIAMTANALARDRAKGLAAGMDEYITKPVDADTLFTVLSNILGKPIKTGNHVSKSEIFETHSPMEDLPGIDVKDAAKRLNGNHTLLCRAVVDYTLENQHTIFEIKKLIQDGNIPGLLAVVHRFKGVSLNISAVCLGRLLANFEKKIKDEKEKDEPKLMALKADLADIDTQFSLICATAERIREKTDKRPGEAGPFPEQKLFDQMGDMMKKMGELLKKNSLDAKVHAVSFSKELEGTVFAADAGTLALQVKRFDFPSARKTFQCLETAIRKQSCLRP
ncbi:response regulator [Desulfobacter vibrioformis]|uniref:response regulator n=1 Tax=Desulfobacter vibrioformis TaxID=34031 RepID=UPI00069105F8|nr:response regulator [Desulfobacter vibrioformis]